MNVSTVSQTSGDEMVRIKTEPPWCPRTDAEVEFPNLIETPVTSSYMNMIKKKDLVIEDGANLNLETSAVDEEMVQVKSQPIWCHSVQKPVLQLPYSATAQVSPTHPESPTPTLLRVTAKNENESPVKFEFNVLTTDEVTGIKSEMAWCRSPEQHTVDSPTIPGLSTSRGSSTQMKTTTLSELPSLLASGSLKKEDEAHVKCEPSCVLDGDAPPVPVMLYKVEHEEDRNSTPSSKKTSAGSDNQGFHRIERKSRPLLILGGVPDSSRTVRSGGTHDPVSDALYLVRRVDDDMSGNSGNKPSDQFGSDCRTSSLSVSNSQSMIRKDKESAVLECDDSLSRRRSTLQAAGSPEKSNCPCTGDGDKGSLLEHVRRGEINNTPTRSDNLEMDNPSLHPKSADVFQQQNALQEKVSLHQGEQKMFLLIPGDRKSEHQRSADGEQKNSLIIPGIEEIAPRRCAPSQRIHMGRLRCKVCSLSYARPATLNAHMLQHVGKIFICSICGVQYSDETRCRQHELWHKHRNTYSKTGNMRLCRSSLHSKLVCLPREEEIGLPKKTDKHTLNCLKNYIPAKSPEPVELYRCGECGKLFKDGESCRMHQLVHNEMMRKQLKVSDKTAEQTIYHLCRKKSHPHRKPSNLVDFQNKCRIEINNHGTKSVGCFSWKGNDEEPHGGQKHMNYAKVNPLLKLIDLAKPLMQPISPEEENPPVQLDNLHKESITGQANPTREPNILFPGNPDFHSQPYNPEKRKKTERKIQMIIGYLCGHKVESDILRKCICKQCPICCKCGRSESRKIEKTKKDPKSDVEQQTECHKHRKGTEAPNHVDGANIKLKESAGLKAFNVNFSNSTGRATQPFRMFNPKRIRLGTSYNCKICGHSFANTTALSKHNEQPHTTIFKCRVCGTLFHDETKHKIHEMLHRKEEATFIAKQKKISSKKHNVEVSSEQRAEASGSQNKMDMEVKNSTTKVLVSTRQPTETSSLEGTTIQRDDQESACVGIHHKAAAETPFCVLQGQLQGQSP